MKVNTDGVLLGAWTDVSRADKILDIGTGTGVIALMLAQRNPKATVTAIDIDQDAYLQATENTIVSPWSDRLSVQHVSLQEMMGDTLYDLIVSNPPYFINDYISDDAQRNLARHGSSLPYADLINGVARLLSPDGQASIILPYFNVEQFLIMAAEKGLYLSQRTDVVAVRDREPYVSMLALSRLYTIPRRNSITIQEASGTFTDEYRHLTQDFYLKF
ncbi:MAG: methyltransferase [Bacteroidetes bacterium]|nr:methyltransferase [Bacteroidota bacterium]